MTSSSVETVEPYSLLRTSLTLFEKTPEELDEDQLKQVQQQATKEHSIESLILSSSEAAQVMISDQELEKAMQEVKQRFDDEDAFEAEMERNGLDLKSLEQALQRQCKVENIMDLVGSRSADISDMEIGLYFHMHPEKFHRDEHRRARHILVTINDEYDENTREKAQARINEVAEKLRQRPEKFADLALKYSECPTSLQGGELGSVPQGRLYPELDEILFKLEEGQMSKVIETEVGFHIITCIQIIPEQNMSLKEAGPQIRKMMEEKAKRTCQRAWLAELKDVRK